MRAGAFNQCGGEVATGFAEESNSVEDEGATDDRDAVSYVAERGLITGYSGTTLFGVAVVLMRAFEMGIMK